MSDNFSSTANKRTVLFESDSFEVVSIEWTATSLSPEHNHGWSECSILVQEGVFENSANIGSKIEVQILEKGQVLNTPVGAKHSMRCLSQVGKTLHVYSPKIKELSDDGKFKIQNRDDLKSDLQLSQPTSFVELKKLIAKIQDHSVSTQSPYFMNQLFSGISPQMLLAQDLISQTKTTLATQEASPAFSAIEAEVVEKLGELIGWPQKSRDGVNVPGGSAANFMAVHCARQRLIPEIKTMGISGQVFKIFVSAEAHYSFKKAGVVLGLGTESVVSVPVDESGRMQPDKLDQLIHEAKMQNATPLLVAATAGTTVLGAFDPLDELATVCQKHSLWLHVDAAWGGPALFSKNLRSLMTGIAKADSVTFDAHKLFGAAMTCSFFLTKHSGILIAANDVSGGDYLFHSNDPNIDRGKLSWQCGRGADAVSFWTIWKSFGTEGLGQLVDGLINIRKQTQEWLKGQSRLELVAEPEFLNLCVRVKPPFELSKEDQSQWSQKVRESLKENNQAMVNYSTNKQGTFLRFIFAHPDLEFHHIQQVLQWALAVK